MDMPAETLPPYRQVNYAERRVEIDERPDGSIVLRNPHPVGEPASNLIEPLRKWAVERPDHVWLGKRLPPKDGQQFGDWETVTYADANTRVNALAEGMLARGLSQDAPLMILSGNSIEHALMTYGAILAGAPAVPVSPSYSLMSSDHEKLKYVVDLIQPKMIFVQDSRPFEGALGALDLQGIPVVACEGPCDITYADLVATAPTDVVEKSYASLHWDMVSKYLFTSGSTGMPKAVITTHRMMCMNSVMAENLIIKDEDEEPPVLLNWLPWNHCFGGNAVLNNLLTSGGTLYIDGGRPVPGGFEETLQNLREIAPTTYSNVPAAYGLLIAALEEDDALAKNFFSRVKFLSYGGAALAQDLYDRLQKVSIRTIGERMILSSGYGATETAPTIMNVHWATERMGLLGLPLPGVDIKMVPVGSKHEVRVKGECITKGYYKNPEKTADAYDEEGFYKLGDAAKFVDPDNPAEGLVFDGRVVEDFKLSTGTWVSAGRLRVQTVGSSNGILHDALVAGLDEAYIGILGFPNVAACQACAGEGDLPVDELVRHPKVLETLAEGLRAHNQENPGSSTRIKRALLMVEPPSVDKGELTDKGYINQSTALARRDDLVKKLYEETPGNDVVVL
ncbi:MAG: AMP-binding protein [Rhodobiaceae bacterium]|nr:AMP-binding protein [Rhodobiaceae bacterium]